jgi:hypothetical protein
MSPVAKASPQHNDNRFTLSLSKGAVYRGTLPLRQAQGENLAASGPAE